MPNKRATENQRYNAERKAQAELIKRDIDRDKVLARLYQESYDRMQSEIDRFYLAYAGKEGLTKQEAMKKASEFDVEKFAKKAEKAVKEKDFSPKTNSWLRTYNLKMKVSRLELLKAELALEIQNLTSDVNEVFDKARRDEYLAEFKRQAGILGISSSGAKKRMQSILDADFYGQKFSSRIWGSKGLQANLQGEVSSSLIRIFTDMTGYKQEMARLAKKYETSKANAQRLLKTEIARINADTQLAMLKDNGFTHMIFVVEPGACDICGPLDQKAIPIDKVEKGVNMFPMHPNCRCSAYGHIKMDYKEGGSTLDQFEKWNESEDNIILEQTGENIKIDFSKLTTEEINNLDFDDLMKYYEWVEEQERFKQLEEKERMNIFMDSFSNGLDLKQKTLSNFDHHARKWYNNHVEKQLSFGDIESASNKIKDVLENSELSMRFKSENIDKLIESKRFMNQFETGTSGGTINVNYRRQATEQLFGIKGGRFKKSDFEKYGYFANKDPYEDFLYNSKSWGGVSQYGDVIVRFSKDKMLSRTTFTINNSLGPAIYKDLVADNPNSPHLLSIDKNYLQKYVDLLKNKNARTPEELTKTLGIRYVEAQFHGEVGLTDVSSMYFTSKIPNNNQVKTLKSYGIDVFVKEGEKFVRVE